MATHGCRPQPQPGANGPARLPATATARSPWPCTAAGHSHSQEPMTTHMKPQHMAVHCHSPPTTQPKSVAAAHGYDARTLSLPPV